MNASIWLALIAVGVTCFCLGYAVGILSAPSIDAGSFKDTQP